MGIVTFSLLIRAHRWVPLQLAQFALAPFPFPPPGPRFALTAKSPDCPPFPLKAMSSPTDAAITRAAEEPASQLPGDGADVVVQYVVLRRDLIDTWPLGSIVTQGCHASVAAIWSHRHHPDVVSYCSVLNIDSMHKVTLEVKGETQLRNLAENLQAGGIDHKLWIEQPENTPTCLATRPYQKSQVASFFKKLKLCK